MGKLRQGKNWFFKNSLFCKILLFQSALIFLGVIFFGSILSQQNAKLEAFRPTAPSFSLFWVWLVFEAFLAVFFSGLVLWVIFRQFWNQLSLFPQWLKQQQGKTDTNFLPPFAGELQHLAEECQSLMVWNQTESKSKEKENPPVFLEKELVREQYNLTILGIKFPDFSVVLEHLPHSLFEKLNRQILDAYLQSFERENTELLFFDGNYCWLGFKGENAYENLLKTIQNVKKAAFSLHASWSKIIKYAFKPIFFIHEGVVFFSRLPFQTENKEEAQQSSPIYSRTIPVLGGSGLVKARSIFLSIDQGEIWATFESRFGLQNLCYLMDSSSLEKFMDGLSVPLLIVSLEPVKERLLLINTKKEEILPPKKQKPAKTVDSNPNQKKGLADVLEETLNQEV